MPVEQLKKIKKNILSVIGRGDILFIVPPFVTAKTPIVAPHILQSIAQEQEQGYNSDILYVNLLLASIIGIDLYESILNSPALFCHICLVNILKNRKTVKSKPYVPGLCIRLG